PDITFLPEPAQIRLLRGRPASGSVSVDGHGYFFAAEPRIQGKFFVLLRPKSVTKSQWKPFAYGLLIAALAGSLLAALVAFLLARRISRPVRRVAEAARSLARGAHPDPIPVEGLRSSQRSRRRSTTSPRSSPARERRSATSSCRSATS